MKGKKSLIARKRQRNNRSEKKMTTGQGYQRNLVRRPIDDDIRKDTETIRRRDAKGRY